MQYLDKISLICKSTPMMHLIMVSGPTLAVLNENIDRNINFPTL